MVLLFLWGVCMASINAMRLTIPTGDLENYRFAEPPRFHCLHCEDTGFVTIWQPDSIKQARRDPDDVEWRKCATACRCEKPVATEWPAHWNTPNAGKPLPIFGERSWHIKATTETAKVDAALYIPPTRREID
jgi:hypothetical protein